MSRNFEMELARLAEWLTQDWIVFAMATALLWLPFPTLSQAARLRWLLLRDATPEVGKVLSNWRNYLDLLRSGVAAAVLVAFAVRLEANPQVQPEALWLPSISLLIGTLIQTVRLAPPVTLMAPNFYLAGLTLALPGPIEGAFAVIFGWALAIGAKDVRLQLPAMGLALLLGGFFNQNTTQWLFLNGGLIFLPMILALLFNKRLAYSTREPKPICVRAKPRTIGTSQQAAA